MDENQDEDSLKKKILKWSLALVLIAGLTVAVFFLFRAIGITINPFAPDDALGAGLEGELLNLGFALYVVFAALYVFQSLTLSFVPGNATIFVAIGVTLFSGGDIRNISFADFMIAFAVIATSVLIASIGLYFLGRFAGRKLLNWMFGKKNIEHRLEWLAQKGTKVVPWLFLIPMMPTDLICLLCGSSRMRFLQFLAIVIIFRPVEVLLLMLYPLMIGIIRDGTDIWTQILLVNVLVINIFLLFTYHKTLIRIFNRTFARKKLEQQEAKELAESKEHTCACCKCKLEECSKINQTTGE